MGLNQAGGDSAIDQTWDRAATREVLGDVRAQVVAVARRAADRGGLWPALLAGDVRAELAETSFASATDAILAATWARLAEIEPSLPAQPTLGATITVRLAAATIALDEVLRARGIDARASAALIYRVGWRFYRRLGEAPQLLAAALTRDPAQRLRIATDVFRNFPFGAPAYQWRDVAAPNDVIAFDCLRCPVAELFAAHAASDLCVETFCKLDIPLAEMWGGQLERTGTIASGAGRCDFRWHITDSARDPTFVPVDELRAHGAGGSMPLEPARRAR